MPPADARIVLVDGTCIVCNRIVATLLRHDRRGEFYFAHLQGDYARAVLARHGIGEADPDAIYVILNPETAEEEVRVDGAAGREVWPRVFGAAVILRWIPLGLLNFGYRLFARVRFPLFGQAPACIVPTAAQRARFLA
jgi:predicted DCC family thiol-disulfide oxidoreductase YuxK